MQVKTKFLSKPWNWCMRDYLLLKLKSNTMYPLTGFNFRIKFKGLDDPDMVDTHFQSISGLEAIIEKNSINQGGAILASALILKRAVRNSQSSALNRWLFSHFNKN